MARCMERREKRETIDDEDINISTYLKWSEWILVIQLQNNEKSPESIKSTEDSTSRSGLGILSDRKSDFEKSESSAESESTDSSLGNYEIWEKREGCLGFKLSIDSLKSKFPPEEYKYGLYEIMAQRRTRLETAAVFDINDFERVALYLGNSARKTKVGVYNRVHEYCKNGSHIRNLVEDALDKGYDLLFRVASVRKRKDTKTFEGKLLDEYDYAWNSNRNGERRYVLAHDANRDNTKVLRENLNYRDCLNSGWEWSNWVTIISPGKIHTGDALAKRYKNRKSVGICIRERELNKLFPDAASKNGIFELMLLYEESCQVVYVGCTFKGCCCDLLEQILYVCEGNSSKEALIKEALAKKYTICVRVRVSDKNTKTVAERDENKLLDRYNYAWNLRRNTRIQYIHIAI